MDFLLELIKLFSLGVTAEKLQKNIGWKSAISLQRGPVDPKFQKNRLNDLSYDITINSSGDEIANVNFLYDDIVHVLQNAIDSCINSATDRRGYVLERMFTKFSEITQYNGHYEVQGHSRSLILVPIESSYDFLLVINTNLPPILHRLQVIPDYSLNFRQREGVPNFIAIASGDPLSISPYMIYR